jgi:hypothetical protein
MPMPNITQAQVAAVVAALVAVIGVISQAPERLQLPLVIVIGAIAVTWIVSDVYLRGKRTETVTASHQVAIAQLQNLPSDGDDSLVDAAPPAGK